jgi:hypothetical protein
MVVSVPGKLGEQVRPPVTVYRIRKKRAVVAPRSTPIKTPRIERITKDFMYTKLSTIIRLGTANADDNFSST